MRTIGIAALLLAGCIDEFQGSNVQLDFASGMPVQASPGAIPRAGELAANVHFTLYAFSEANNKGSLFELDRFEVHRIVDLASPCFIDVGEHVPHPGLHVSQYATVIGEDTGIPDYMNPPPGATEQQKIDAATAAQRQKNVETLAGDSGIKVVSSASAGGYDPVGADCADTTALPPPACTDAASNQRRLALCQKAWKDDAALFEGTDRILTAPLNGTTHGMVDGMNPINLAPVGGAQFFVDENLAGFDGYAVYWQYDDANLDGKPDYPPTVPPADQSEAGELLLFGKPTHPTRGVTHVHLTSLAQPGLTADMAIFANLDGDNVSF